MIKNLPHHYSYDTPATVHDEEQGTVLQLLGRQGGKINEVVNDQNDLRQETTKRLSTMEEKQIPEGIKKEVQDQINDGTFDKQISDYAGDLQGQLDHLIGSTPEGSTTLDLELIGIREDFVTGESQTTARKSLEGAFQYSIFPSNAISSGSHSLNDKAYRKPGVYSFVYGCELTGTPEEFSLYPDTENNVCYLKVEAFGLRRDITGGNIIDTPEGVQHLYNRKMITGWKRFWYTSGTTIIWGAWMPLSYSQNCITLSLDQKADLDLNHIHEENRYIVASAEVPNAPIKDAGFLLNVREHTRGWIIQEAFGLLNDSRQFYRVGNFPGGSTYIGDLKWGEWKQVKTTDMWDHEDIITPGVDINGLVEPKTYIIGVTDSKNNPGFTSGYLVKTDSYNKGWLVQYAHPIYPDRQMFYRTGKNNNNDIATNFAEGLDVEWSAWKELAHMDEVRQMFEAIEPAPGGSSGGSSSGGSNVGQVIVNLGDSNFGNTRDNTSVSAYLSQITGATVHNFGFGGTRATDREDLPWKPFSLCNLVYAIINNNDEYWADIEEALEHTDTPEYFRETVAQMKALDWNSVDIITICFGTNDHSAGVEADGSGWDWDTSLDDLDDSDFRDSLLRSVDTLQCALPNARIVLITPPDKFIGSDSLGAIPDDFNNGTDEACNFKTYEETFEWIQDKISVPVVQTRKNLSITYNNYSNWMDDGVHFNAKGRKAWAKLIAKTISGM